MNVPLWKTVLLLLAISAATALLSAVLPDARNAGFPLRLIDKSLGDYIMGLSLGVIGTRRGWFA